MQYPQSKTFTVDANTYQAIFNPARATTSTFPSCATAQPKQRKMIAHWLVDENAKLYCQWLPEDSQGKIT